MVLCAMSVFCKKIKRFCEIVVISCFHGPFFLKLKSTHIGVSIFWSKVQDLGGLFQP